MRSVHGHAPGCKGSQPACELVDIETPVERYVEAATPTDPDAKKFRAILDVLKQALVATSQSQTKKRRKK